MQGRPSAARQRTAACPCWSPAGGQFKIHQVKINRFTVDFEIIRKCTQLPKAVFFIQSDGAGIVAAHLQIQLLEAVLLGKGKNRFCQRRRRGILCPCAFYDKQSNCSTQVWKPALSKILPHWHKNMFCLIFRHHIGFLHSLRGNCCLIYGLDCTFACISCFYISHRLPPFSKK